MGRSSGSGLRGRNLPHEQREKGRDEEGQHDRSEYVGEGEHRGLSTGKVPSNALLQALVWNRAGGTPLLTIGTGRQQSPGSASINLKPGCARLVLEWTKWNNF